MWLHFLLIQSRDNDFAIMISCCVIRWQSNSQFSNRLMHSVFIPCVGIYKLTELVIIIVSQLVDNTQSCICKEGKLLAREKREKERKRKEEIVMNLAVCCSLPISLWRCWGLDLTFFQASSGARGLSINGSSRCKCFSCLCFILMMIQVLYVNVYPDVIVHIT